MNQPENIPKETLYLSDLNDKIKPIDMKYALYFLFSQYGEILEVVCKKNQRMRGQGFIVFSNITSATNAKHALNGFNLFDKQVKISFSNKRSDVIEKIEGSFDPKKKLKKNLQKQNASHQNQQQQLQQQTQSIEEKKNEQPVQLNPQNNVLIFEHQAINISNQQFSVEGTLINLFNKYPGYKTVRYMSQKNLGFVEFEEENQAQVALIGLQGFQIIPLNHLKINYAKIN